MNCLCIFLSLIALEATSAPAQPDYLKRILDQEFGAKDTLKTLLYVWNGMDKPIVQSSPPPWYRNKFYDRLKTPRVCVYDINGEMIDDTHALDTFSERWQKRQDYATWLQQREARRTELIALKENKQIEIGMTPDHVLFILGVPKSKRTTEKMILWHYSERKWVSFVDGKVASFETNEFPFTLD